jgi:deoxyribodipyrimidine photo-lyase
MASNQHGWQWCAGSGTDAAPYFRIFNPTNEKIDPSGDYIRRWVAELSAVNDVRLSHGEHPPEYPPPIVDHSSERAEALRRYQRIS